MYPAMRPGLSQYLPNANLMKMFAQCITLLQLQYLNKIAIVRFILNACHFDKLAHLFPKLGYYHFCQHYILFSDDIKMVNSPFHF